MTTVRIDCGTFYYMSLFIDVRLTKSACLSKLNDDMGSSLVGRVLSQYRTVLDALMNC